jgi:hypothetical protein
MSEQARDIEREQRAEASATVRAAADMFQYDVPNAGGVAELVGELGSPDALGEDAPVRQVWARRPRQYESDLSMIAVAAAREAFDRRDWELLARIVMMTTQGAFRFREWLEAKGRLAEADGQQALEGHLSRPMASRSAPAEATR